MVWTHKRTCCCNCALGNLDGRPDRGSLESAGLKVLDECIQDLPVPPVARKVAHSDQWRSLCLSIAGIVVRNADVCGREKESGSRC